MPLKPIPIGVDIFEKFSRHNYYYVDKTLFIKELLDKKGDVNLFTRPRRFGKTLLLTMLRYFFENTGSDAGNEKSRAMFSGLKIMAEGETYTQHMCGYPVIFLTLKSGKQPTFASSYNALKECIAYEYKRHIDILPKLEMEKDRAKFMDIIKMKGTAEDYNTSLLFLCECLEKVYHQNTIILIDEYDVPLENAYFAGFYNDMVSVIYSLFISALKTNPYLEFAVIMGCNRISKDSFFAELNNLGFHSVLAENYSEYFGFTETEVREMLGYYGRGDGFDVTKDWYDGYMFGNTEVYNPWSVINHVKNIYYSQSPYPKPYWVNTSSNSIIRDLLENADVGAREEIELLIQGGSITKPVHEDVTYGEIRGNMDNLWNFLFFTGYLKKCGEEFTDDRLYLALTIPNKEIRSIYRDKITQWFSERVKSSDMPLLIKAITSKDTAALQRELNDRLKNTISYHDTVEAFYHGFLAGILSNSEDYEVKSNREAGNGRSDIYMRELGGRDFATVFELKVADARKSLKAACAEALAQIEEKAYDRELLAEGYEEVLRFGVAFYKKECLVCVGE